MITKHFASEVVAELLRQNTIGTNPLDNLEWPIFTATLQSEPDEAIAVADYGKPVDGRLHRTGETILFWGVQTTVRSSRFQKAREKIYEIWKFCEGVTRTEVTVQDQSYVIQAIHQLLTPSYIGSDPNNRIVFTLNSLVCFAET